MADPLLPSPPPDGTVVVTEAAQLRALAHPLRLRLLGLLRLEGPSTASRLAARTGQSSGLTSYHLRQLAASGFVADAPTPAPAGPGAGPGASSGTGTSTGGRERWWRAAHRYTWTSSPPPQDLEAVAAAEDFERVVVGVYAERSLAWLAARPTWPQEYVRAATSSDVPLRLTPAEMTSLREELFEVVGRYRAHDPARVPGATGGPDGAGDAPDDAVVVTVQLQLYPEPGQVPPGPDGPAGPDDGDGADGPGAGS